MSNQIRVTMLVSSVAMIALSMVGLNYWDTQTMVPLFVFGLILYVSSFSRH